MWMMCQHAFVLDLKALGWSSCHYMNTIIPFTTITHWVILRVEARSVFDSPTPSHFPWLPLCEPNSEPCLFMLLPGSAVFSVGGRVLLRGLRTDVAYIMISKSVISAALILLASLHSPPHGSRLNLLRQALLCCAVPHRAEPESLRHVSPSCYWLEAANQWAQQGELLQLRWKAIINICQWGDNQATGW